MCPMGLGALAGPRTERQADLQQGWACGPDPKSSVSAWTGLRVPPSCQPPWSGGCPGAWPKVRLRRAVGRPGGSVGCLGTDPALFTGAWPRAHVGLRPWPRRPCWTRCHLARLLEEGLMMARGVGHGQASRSPLCAQLAVGAPAVETAEGLEVWPS